MVLDFSPNKNTSSCLDYIGLYNTLPRIPPLQQFHVKFLDNGKNWQS